MPNKPFESVVKIQHNRIRSMTGIEKFACKSLILSLSSADSVPETSEEEERNDSIMESIGKKKGNLDEAIIKYIDASFICGSAAKVERLWSQANYIVQNHRKVSTPRLAEAILFLKTNKSYWDLLMVCEAMASTRNVEEICISSNLVYMLDMSK